MLLDDGGRASTTCGAPTAGAGALAIPHARLRDVGKNRLGKYAPASERVEPRRVFTAYRGDSPHTAAVNVVLTTQILNTMTPNLHPRVQAAPRRSTKSWIETMQRQLRADAPPAARREAGA